MPNAYMRAVYKTLNRASHLAGVNSIPAVDLDTLCVKYNYAADAAGNKGQMNPFLDYMTAQAVRNTDQLTARLNREPGFLLTGMIDKLWLLMAEPVPANEIVPYAQMVDPNVEVTNGSMLSHTVGGFRKLGIAFRGDNRAYHEFGAEGFTSRYAVPASSRFHIPEAQGTAIAGGMFYDRQSRDFLNQTGVCIARNLVGSMKFIDSTKTSARLYAVQVHAGADTEKMQQIKGGDALWRPGEKAAWQVPKQDMLASIPVDVSMHDDKRINDERANSVWFEYRYRGEWEFHQNADDQRRKYILQSTFGRSKDVWYSFKRGEDFALKNYKA